MGHGSGEALAGRAVAVAAGVAVATGGDGRAVGDAGDVSVVGAEVGTVEPEQAASANAAISVVALMERISVT
jgi:hypothetical protein